MAQFILVILSATGLIILGARVTAIGSATCWRTRTQAVGRCALDWGLSLSLAFVGGMCGGVVGGVAGLVAGPIVSLLVSNSRKTVKEN